MKFQPIRAISVSMSSFNFMLSWVEHKKYFITSSVRILQSSQVSVDSWLVEMY